MRVGQQTHERIPHLLGLEARQRSDHGQTHSLICTCRVADECWHSGHGRDLTHQTQEQRTVFSPHRVETPQQEFRLQHRFAGVQQLAKRRFGNTGIRAKIEQPIRVVGGSLGQHLHNTGDYA